MLIQTESRTASARPGGTAVRFREDTDGFFERIYRMRVRPGSMKGPRWRNFNSLSNNLANQSGAGVGGLGTTAKIFSLSGLGVTALILNVDSGGNPGKLEGRTWEIRAAGNLYAHGSSPTANVVLQSGKSLTATSNTSIATLGSAQSVTTATNFPWAVSALVQGTTASGILQGKFQIVIDNTLSAAAALSNALTGLVFSPGVNPVIQLVAGVTFSVSDALSVATLTEFMYGF